MPAYGNFIRDKGYDAEAAIVKFRAVKPGATAEGVTPVTATGEDGRGVAQFDVTATDITHGKGASVREDGTTEWEVLAGQTFANGTPLTCDATGVCRAAVSTNRIWGKARQAVAASPAGMRIAVDLAVVKQIMA
jgi:hypothetical protein